VTAPADRTHAWTAICSTGERLDDDRKDRRRGQSGLATLNGAPTRPHVTARGAPAASQARGRAATLLVMTAPIQYAKSGDVHIAYQIVGEGPFDLVVVPAFVSNIELDWEIPQKAAFYERLASVSRLIRLDKRGTGLSDRVSDLPSLETRMDDVRTVLDAAGSERAALFGASEGGPISLLFAATYPERTTALVL
jgi:pimeloyl-ACP methyl ester carboxylesterase